MKPDIVIQMNFDCKNRQKYDTLKELFLFKKKMLLATTCIVYYNCCNLKFELNIHVFTINSSF